MNDKILVAYNETEQSQKALEYAADSFPESEITAIYVIEPSQQTDAYVPQAGEDRVEQAEETLESAAGGIEGREIQAAIEVGKADQKIVDYADENDFDLIVIGSHGRTKAPRLLLGSVAEKIVRHSPVPVLVTK